MHPEQLSDGPSGGGFSGDGLVDEMLRLRSAVPRPRAHQVCWYHPGLWPGRSSPDVTTGPRFVPGAVAYRSALRPSASSAATGCDA